MRILMIEDEKYIARAVAEVLKKSHYTVDLAYDGEYGLECSTMEIYDAVILDIMLPKRDGLSVLREMRKQGIKTPVLLLTARGEVEDRVQGLDLGADDYLAKPFHTDELLARLRAICRRKVNEDYDGLISFSDIKLSPHTLMLKYDGGEVSLTLKETQILEILMNNVNRIVTKGSIIEKVWGYDTDVEDNHVESHISLLRKKMSGAGTAARIRTIRGAGYTLISGEDGS
ncbi:MAG: response regulator transcription factor [Clostridiales Family XIII bacterium]|nr:response regulator transcription factor [Clostridiales Family XIII bacterium]